MEATFDQLLIKSEKEEAKKNRKRNFSFFKTLSKRKDKIVSKFLIKAKIRNLKSDLNKTQKAFIQSFTDPTMDSVDLKLRVMGLENKLKTAQDLYKQLFYNRFVLFFIKLFTSKN